MRQDLINEKYFSLEAQDLWSSFYKKNFKIKTQEINNFSRDESKQWDMRKNMKTAII